MKKTRLNRFIAAVLVVAALSIGLTVAPSAAIGGFGDVEAGLYYSDAVQWLVNEDLTTGTSSGCFSPDRALTRGELGTFLWRYAQEPEGGAHPFDDVSSTAFYADAIAWMYRAGVTTGTSLTKFSPNQTITRAEMATLLWRYDGQDSASPAPFADVSSSAFYADAVDWMVERGITTGTTATTFSPLDPLTRAQFATFLWRYEGAPAVRDSGSGICVSSTSAPNPGTPPPSTTLPPATGDLMFFEDFASNDAMSQFDHGIFHRDDSVIAAESWLGDHAPTGADDACSSPFEKRTIERGNRSEGFNNDWIYRCAPGGDTAKAHLMTSIGDTSGYSLGGFSPTQVFTNVREVRWDVNQTDLGDRQWTEIAIIPADRFDFANLPCTGDVPCDTTTHPELGSVGTQWSAQFARKINTPASPNGYLQAAGDLGYRCDTCPYAPSASFGEAYGQGDSALTSFAIRRTNFFRDNGDGTLTWGFQLEDGSFNEFTAPGAFPSGPVRVVFKDHNYTPMKSPATLLPETTFTWHWDNIGVYG
jgi:hypothetical protein